jgi:hypothetical protein
VAPSLTETVAPLIPHPDPSPEGEGLEKEGK